MILTQYPSITLSEFSEGCATLEITSSDRLDDTDWVGLKWTGEELRIKQQRHVKKRKSQEQEVGVEMNDQSTDVLEGFIDEDDDVEEILSCPSRPATSEDIPIEVIEVDFSVTISAIYSVPVLWITSSAIGSIDQIHELLLPKHLNEAVRSIGVMGGISRAYHPVSDLPAFFIHPCNTHEALLAVHDGESLSTEEYILLWLGLIGSSVGLHVPSKLVSIV